MPKTEFQVKLHFLFHLPGPDGRISTLTALTDVHSVTSVADEPNLQGSSSAQKHTEQTGVPDTAGACVLPVHPRAAQGLLEQGQLRGLNLALGDAPGQDPKRAWARGAPS